jgi:DNA-binding CsgD family transcriptional regulator/GAF domain-containing protein
MSTTVPPAPPTESRPDRQLFRQLDQFVHDSSELLETEMELTPTTSGSMTMAATVLAGISSTALSRVEQLDKRDRVKARRLVSVTLRALELTDAVHSRIAGQRTRTYTSMREGLDRLRRAASSAVLLDRVCQEVVATCGFSRAVLTRIEDGEWLPWMAHFSDDHELERQYVAWMNEQHFPASALGRDLWGLRPVLVRDAVADPRAFTRSIQISKTPCYVAAPITPAGRLVGVVYADRYPTGRPVDELDRDMLWAFAEDFGRIYERMVLIERMRAQHAQINRAFEFAEGMMSSLANAEIELSRTPEGRMPGGDEAEFGTPAAPASVEELLTAREAEVLAMMVRGASNAVIAEKLIIKEGTVKSHVKHILRKLDAVNRAEAISRYMGRSDTRSAL